MDCLTREPWEAAAFHCRTLLREHDLHGVLRFLNARTRHRYTGVYLLRSSLLHSLSLFDRENPSVRQGGDIRLEETYCSLVLSDEAPFATSDAGHEARLAAHPARSSVLAYCGVPLRSEAVGCIGTLCHFDPRPRLAPVEELPLLQAVASLLTAEVLRLRAQP